MSPSQRPLGRGVKYKNALQGCSTQDGSDVMAHVSAAQETYWAVPHSCAYCGPCSTCPVTHSVTAVTSQFALLSPRATSCSSSFPRQPTARQQVYGSHQGTVYPKGGPSTRRAQEKACSHCSGVLHPSLNQQVNSLQTSLLNPACLKHNCQKDTTENRARHL